MLRINRELEYAMITLKTLSEEERVFSSRELAERHAIPTELLRKILQRLAQGGLVGVERGQKGGYSMLRGPDEISLGEVADAVLGKQGMVQCLAETDGGECAQGDACTIRENMASFQRMWERFLHSVSLKEFVENRSKDWTLSLS